MLLTWIPRNMQLCTKVLNQGFFFNFVEGLLIIHKRTWPNLSTGQRGKYKFSGTPLYFGDMLESLVEFWWFQKKGSKYFEPFFPKKNPFYDSQPLSSRCQMAKIATKKNSFLNKSQGDIHWLTNKRSKWKHRFKILGN